MKRKKIDVKFYGVEGSSELFSFDKETFDLITNANAELARMVTVRDHRIAVLEKALEIALEMTTCEYCPKDIAEKCDSWLGLGNGENCIETLKKYCITQAEKKLEEEE